MRVPVLGLILSSWMLCSQLVMAWDGNWTEAPSGDLWKQPEGTDGVGHSDERPETFFIPTRPDFKDVDPEELSDYFHRYRKEYTPYALARIQQTLHYQNLVLPKGYYLIKPGDETDGSPQVTLKTNTLPPLQAEPMAMPPENPMVGSRFEYVGQVQSATRPSELIRQAKAAMPPAAPSNITLSASKTQKVVGPSAKPVSGSTAGSSEKIYQVFVIKKLGRVVAVVPIHRMENYRPKRKDKIPHQALAWVEEENRHPVLKFYYRKRIYSTDFQ
jgi:hypothetical protein